MDQVRIGIIGFGGMGSSHGRYLAAGKVSGATLTAACDVNPARLEAAKAEFEVVQNADPSIVFSRDQMPEKPRVLVMPPGG